MWASNLGLCSVVMMFLLCLCTVDSYHIRVTIIGVIPLAIPVPTLPTGT